MPQADRTAPSERNWRAIAILAMLIAAGMAVASFYGRLSSQDADRQGDAIRTLTRRLDALEPGIGRNAPMVSQRVPARGPLPALSAVAVQPAEGEAAGMTPGQVARQQDQLMQALEAGFAAQPVDGNAPRVEIELLGRMNDRLLSETGITPRDPDVTCKRDTCRITAQFRSDADATDWAVYYLSTAGAGYVGNSRQVLVRNPDGSIQLKLYANRPK